MILNRKSLCILFIIFIITFLIISIQAAPKHYIERVFQKYNLSIYCVDGYKFVDDGASVVQFFIRDNKGNSFPAKCQDDI